MGSLKTEINKESHSGLIHYQSQWSSNILLDGRDLQLPEGSGPRADGVGPRERVVLTTQSLLGKAAL